MDIFVSIPTAYLRASVWAAFPFWFLTFLDREIRETSESSWSIDSQIQLGGNKM